MPARIATRVTSDFFDDVQLDAGILVKNWDPTHPTTVTDAMIVCATTGGINPKCVPTYSDLFEDVDNAPNGSKEGMHLDKWDCSISTTAVNHDLDTIRLALGAAEKVGTKVTPRSYIKDADFTDLAWMGDMASGDVAVVLIKNALSSGGYSLQTTKNGKGQLSLEISGHPSIADMDDIPMEFYIVTPPAS